MTDEPMPDEGDASPTDPFEAELVAYLDGELEPSAARKVEVRLAADPDARAKATALKKTFGLLDYLPKPEPSPTFTTRTLERLPVLKPSPAQTGSQKPLTNSGTQSSNSPTVASSSAIPATRSSASVPLALPVANHWHSWAAGVLIAVGACSAAGYLASGAVYPYLFPSKGQRDGSGEEVQLSDHQIVERLPLYAAVDDLDFVNELSKPEFFGDDPVVSFDLAMKPPVVDAEKPSGSTFAKLAATFKALPHVRQQAIRDLDKQLRSLDAPMREQQFRVLEVYTIWLDKLPDAEHKHVLTAETPRRRLDEIRKIRNQQWLDGLPPAQRAKLNGLPAASQVELIRQWREEESAHRDEWAFHRTHAEDIVSNKVPWPFDDLARQKEVIDFMHVTFHPDDKKDCRFDEIERTRYNDALTLATQHGGWTWYGYGRNALAMVKKYERYILPEPAVGDPVTKYVQLGTAARFFSKEKGPAHNATAKLEGKWPDFALAVHTFGGSVKLEKLNLPSLGPSRAGDFKEPLRTFLQKDLVPKLSATDRKTLEAFEGKWPEYPREVVRLAKQYDLSAPGMMLPGSPRRWDTMYGIGPRFKP